jgi:YVTN family beta-propeller protein
LSLARRAAAVAALSALALPGPSSAAPQGPFGQPEVPVSSKDRVYSADQTSNTVSVIDPAKNALLGVLKLGDPVPGALGALYKGALLVHGLGYAPDGKTLAVVSVGSNGVTFVETATNAVKGTVYVGRAPHEAAFTPDGREVWVTVRGENYVSVLDPVALRETRRIPVANGPGMVAFRPDGRFAFVCSSFSPELAVVDVKTHEVVARQPQGSPFSPNVAVTPEGDEVWLTLKDSARVQIFAAEPPFAAKGMIDTGPITNHVNFASNANGKFAYVTVGGVNQVKAFRRGPKPELVATVAVGDLPHGLWPSGDGTRVYVAIENGSKVQAIDTLKNEVVATVGIGQTAQALVYVPNAVPSGSGADKLVPLGAAGNTARLELAAPPGAELAQARASAAVNSLGLLDLVQIAASGLAPKTEYRVWLSETPKPPFGELVPLATLRTQPDGAGVAQAVGPLKAVAQTAADAGKGASQRYLVVSAPNEPAKPVLLQVGGVSTR